MKLWSSSSEGLLQFKVYVPTKADEELEGRIKVYRRGRKVKDYTFPMGEPAKWDIPCQTYLLADQDHNLVVDLTERIIISLDKKGLAYRLD